MFGCFVPAPAWECRRTNPNIFAIAQVLGVPTQRRSIAVRVLSHLRDLQLFSVDRVVSYGKRSIELKIHTHPLVKFVKFMLAGSVSEAREEGKDTPPAVHF